MLKSRTLLKLFNFRFQSTFTPRLTKMEDALKACKERLIKQSALVRHLKADGIQSKDKLGPEISALTQIKAELAKLELQSGKIDKEPAFDRTAFEELLKRRFYYAPSFQIYGGVSGLYDYGPPGSALQSNIMDVWRKHFVLEEDMLEVDTTILTPHDVLKTSGHVDRFADLMCKDLKTGEIFRVDHLVEADLERRLEHGHPLQAGANRKSAKVPLTEQETGDIKFILAQIDGYNQQQLCNIIAKYSIKSPVGNELTQPEVFNLMFGTSIGPTGQLAGFLRPETAQGQFVNFKKLLEFNNERMPFASAQIGKSFRNEISPRSGLLRVREFLMAEIEHYVHPDRKDHHRFHEVEKLELNILPAHVQMSGKSDVVRMTVGDAVSQGIINNQTLGYFLARVNLFLLKIGVKEDKLRFRQHLKNEMAHYAADCWDGEIKTSYGWVECVGCADRSAYDLTKHSEKTKVPLVARETLPEPLTTQKTVLEINKKLFGPAFKKEAKLVETYLMSLAASDLLKMDADLKNGPVNVSVEGKSYSITADLVKVATISETVHVLEYIPSVVEPSFGIGRIMYAVMEHSWWCRDGDENRHVLSFPPIVAPTKCLIVPLSNNESFTPYIRDVSRLLRKSGISNRVDDSGSSIGRRYARNDELGTPFGITVDFQTLQDGTVTLRERDSTKQIRESVAVIAQLVKDMSEDNMQWSDVVAKFPLFQQQEV